MNAQAPHIDAIRSLREQLGDDIVRTPMLHCAGIEDELGNGTSVFGKMEFLQRTGTFKARGALSVVSQLTATERQQGITAVSAGNHAIAVAYAARASGVDAKVVMISTANPLRIELCRALGAEVIMAGDAHTAFERVEEIRETEGRYFVHPFEGPRIAAGTGTLGLEICEQCEEFDVLLVPVGGGGLIAGVANAVKQLRPDCVVIGIEPFGADSMYRSFESGRPESVEKVQTIADSLGAPFAAPYSFELCRRHVDRIVRVGDDAIARAMGFLFRRMKMAVEPACAATTCALLGPLRKELAGRRVALVFCGSNIDWDTWQSQAILA